MDDNKRIEILTKNNKRLIEENDKLRNRIEIRGFKKALFSKPKRKIFKKN